MRATYTILAFSVLLLVHPVQAAEVTMLGGYGLKAGGNVSSVNVSPFNPGIGWQAGAFVRLFELSRYSLALESHYVDRLTDYYSSKTRVRYLSFPMLIQATANPQGTSPYLVLGGQYDLAIKSFDESQELFEDHAADAVWRGAVGVGIEGHSYQANPLIELRYVFDITPAFKSTPSGDVTSAAASLMVGMRF